MISSRYHAGVVVALALFLATACSKGRDADGPMPATSAVVAPTGGAVTIIADAKGFTPSEVHATKGAPLSLIFKRTSDNTCATEVVFPELKIRRPLPLNEAVAIAMPTEVDRTYKFQCGMAMWQGAIVIK
jgi:plastocyanin domain-containing protein